MEAWSDSRARFDNSTRFDRKIIRQENSQPHPLSYLPVTKSSCRFQDTKSSERFASDNSIIRLGSTGKLYGRKILSRILCRIFLSQNLPVAFKIRNRAKDLRPILVLDSITLVCFLRHDTVQVRVRSQEQLAIADCRRGIEHAVVGGKPILLQDVHLWLSI